MKIYIRNIFKNRGKKLEDKNIINKNTIKSENNFNTFESNNILNIKKDTQEFNDKKNHYIRKGAHCSKVRIIKLNANIKKDCPKEKTSKLDNKGKEVDKKISKYNLPKSYYVLLVFMITLAGLSIYMVRKSDNYSMEEDYAVFNSQDNSLNIDENNLVNDNNKNSNLQSINSSNADTRDEFKNTASSVNSNVISQVQEKVNNIIEKKEEVLVFAKPLDGEILKIFSDDKVIYSKTLEMWKTHDGIDIKGSIGDIVYAIERGTIEKIYNDAFYGVTIVINHGQGYKSSYSNLSEDTYINVGDKVKKSEKIGKLGTTSIGEIKDEPHLHFMLYENNVISDPSSIFK